MEVRIPRGEQFARSREAVRQHSTSLVQTIACAFLTSGCFYARVYETWEPIGTSSPSKEVIDRQSRKSTTYRLEAAPVLDEHGISVLCIMEVAEWEETRWAHYEAPILRKRIRRELNPRGRYWKRNSRKMGAATMAIL